ncbi:MAG: hypothetical protein QNJ73_05300 [Gammaproteobacteria bacterium]|nr:hypothetical protein [Gammaproteobacteria bacterium]
MSDTKHSAPLIKNQDTLRRRAWVERALAGVRGRSSTAEDAPIDQSDSPKPKLYVVGSNRAR